MDFLIEALVALLLVVGGGFAIVGSYGLVKLPDFMTRLHGPTKATTLGVGGVLMASMAYFGGVEGEFSLHELLVTLFLFLTAPVTANMLAKAWLHRNGASRTLPDAPTGSGWANERRKTPPG
jgi:multicomponent K+:H+ antiporter subunit G